MIASSLSSSEQETDGFHTADELYEETALRPVTSRGELSVKTVCKDVRSGLMKSVYVQYDPIKMIPQGVQCKQEQRDQSTQTDPIDPLGSREDGAVCTCPHEPNSNKHKSVCEKGTNKSEYSAGRDQIDDDDDHLSGCFLEAIAPTIVPSAQEELNLVSSSQSPTLILCSLSDDEQSPCSVHTPSTSKDHVGIHQCMNISSSLRNTKYCHDANKCMEIGNVENEGSTKCNHLSRLVKDPSSGLKSTRSSPLQKKMERKKGSVEETCRIDQETRETGSPSNERSDCVDDEEESSEDLLRQMGNVKDSPAADETQSVNGKSISSQRSGYRDTQKSESRRIGSPSGEGNKCFDEDCATPRVSRSLSQAPDKDSTNLFISSLAVERSSSPESLDEEAPEELKGTNPSFRGRMFRIRLTDGGVSCSRQSSSMHPDYVQLHPESKTNLKKRTLYSCDGEHEITIMEDPSIIEGTQRKHAKSTSLQSSESASGSSSPLKKKKKRGNGIKDGCKGEKKSHDLGSPSNERSDCVDDEEESSEDLLRQMGDVEDSPSADETQSLDGKSRSSPLSDSCETHLSDSHENGSPSGERKVCSDEDCFAEELLEIGDNKNSPVIEDSCVRHGKSLRRKNRRQLDDARRKTGHSSTPLVSRSLSQAPNKDSTNMYISSLAVERSSSPESLDEEAPEELKGTYSSFRRRMFRMRPKDVGAGCSRQRDGVNSGDDQWCSDFEERFERSLSKAPDKDTSNLFISSLVVERSSSPECLDEEAPERLKETNSSFCSRMFRMRLKDVGADCSRQRSGVISDDEQWCSDFEEQGKSDKIAQAKYGDTSVKPPTRRKKSLVPYSDSEMGSDSNTEGWDTSKVGKGKGQRRSRSLSRRVDIITLSSDTDTGTCSEDKSDVSSLTHSRDHSGKSNRRRLQYTQRERRQIVFYIVDHNLYQHVGGNLMWKEMEREEICPGRTWQSLKEHFRKQILSHIQDYKLTEKQIQKFLGLKK